MEFVLLIHGDEGAYAALDETASMEEAVEWAKRLPLLPTDAVEVRPAR